jgi:hypothetical protein
VAVTVIRILAALFGIGLAIVSFFWAMRILMVKSAEPPRMAHVVFDGVRNVMYLLGAITRNPTRRQQIWSLYVPVSLLAIIAVTLVEIVVAYTLIFYGISNDDLSTSYTNSISSLSVLGFGGLPSTQVQRTLALAEAFTGPVLVALLITYLATMTSSLGQRQVQLRTINAEIGSASSGQDLLERAAVGPGLSALSAVWKDWTAEFTSLEQSYDTVEGYLLLFGLSMHGQWITDAVTVLDAANLRNTAIDLPDDPQAARCLDAGPSALKLVVANFQHFVLSLDAPQPLPVVTRGEFDDLCSKLQEAKVPVVANRDTAWRQFEDRRKTYGDLVDLLHRKVVAISFGRGFTGAGQAKSR